MKQKILITAIMASICSVSNAWNFKTFTNNSDSTLTIGYYDNNYTQIHTISGCLTKGESFSVGDYFEDVTVAYVNENSPDKESDCNAGSLINPSRSNVFSLMSINPSTDSSGAGALSLENNQMVDSALQGLTLTAECTHFTAPLKIRYGIDDAATAGIESETDTCNFTVTNPPTN